MDLSHCVFLETKLLKILTVKVSVIFGMSFSSKFRKANTKRVYWPLKEFRFHLY